MQLIFWEFLRTNINSQMASKGRHKGISGFDVALIRIVHRGFGFLGRKKEVDMVECLRTVQAKKIMRSH